MLVLLSACRTPDTDIYNTTVDLPLYDSTAFVVYDHNWKAIEFYPASARAAVEDKLIEKSTVSPRDFDREIRPPEILVNDTDAIGQLANVVGATKIQKLYKSETNSRARLVENGFALELPDSAFIYGVGESFYLEYIGAIAVDEPAYVSLQKALLKLSRQSDVFLVDWNIRWIMSANRDSGRIEIWRP